MKILLDQSNITDEPEEIKGTNNMTIILIIIIAAIIAFYAWYQSQEKK